MMRRFDITVETGSPDCPMMHVYRDVRDEDVPHEYNLIKSFPNVISVIPQQKTGESWPDYVRYTNALIGDDTDGRAEVSAG